MSGREIAGRSGKVAIADITVPEGRLRPVSEAGVQLLMASIASDGLYYPILLRLRRSKVGAPDRLELIAGGHRLEAVTRLGWAEIDARVYECSDDDARLKELDDNLVGAELSPLDTAVFLVERKRVYERLHPETRAGVAGGKARQSSATEPSSVAGFATATAEKFGISERQVRKIIAAGVHLRGDEVDQLRTAPRPVTLADLQQIGKLADHGLRADVVGRMHAGTARSAAKALRAATGRDARAARDPADQAYEALRAAYERAPIAARRRFRSFLLREGNGS